MPNDPPTPHQGPADQPPIARYTGEYQRELSERLRAWIGSRSVRAVARSTGFNHESVRRWVRGESSIPAEFLIALAHRYNLSPLWLLLGQGGPDSSTRSGTPIDRATTSELLAELALRARSVEDAATLSRMVADQAPRARATAIGPHERKPGA